MDKIKTIPAGRFLYNTGLLFEINRRVLHPLGLALMIEYDDEEGTLSEEDAEISLCDKLWDAREDPDGMIFDEESLKIGAIKYQKFYKEFGEAKILKRSKSLGFVVQPLEGDGIKEVQGVDFLGNTENNTISPLN